MQSLDREKPEDHWPLRISKAEEGSMVFCRFLRESGLDRVRTLVAVAHVAQLAEHVLGKDEVISSILIMGSSSGPKYN